MKKILAYLFAMCMLAAVALPMVSCAPKSSDTGMEASQGEAMQEGAQQEKMGEDMQQGSDEGMQQEGMDEGMQQGSDEGMGEEAQQPPPSQM